MGPGWAFTPLVIEAHFGWAGDRLLDCLLDSFLGRGRECVSSFAIEI